MKHSKSIIKSLYVVHLKINEIFRKKKRINIRKEFLVDGRYVF